MVRNGRRHLVLTALAVLTLVASGSAASARPALPGDDSATFHPGSTHLSTCAVAASAPSSVNCIAAFTGAPGSISLDAFTSSGSPGLLMIQLQRAGSTELSPDLTTADSVTIKVKFGTSFTPVGTISTGLIESTSWDATLRQLTIVAKPRASSWSDAGCVPPSVPPGTCATRATEDFSAMLLIGVFDPPIPDPLPEGLTAADITEFKRKFNGGYVATNAQYFEFPEFKSGRFQFEVGAPHFKTDGGINKGFFKVFMPDAIVADKFGLNPNTVTASSFDVSATGAGGITVDPPIRVLATSGSPAGIVIQAGVAPDTEFPYSVPEIRIAKAAAAAGSTEDTATERRADARERREAAAAPQPAPASAIQIGPSGTISARVTLAGDGARLEIPAGTTVRTATGAAFTGQLEAPRQVSDPTGGKLANAFSFVASGAATGGEVRFSQPITITLPVPAGSDPNALQPMFVDAAGRPSGLVGRAAGAAAVAFETDHLSVYGLARIPKPAVRTAIPAVTPRAGYHSRWAGQSDYVELVPGQFVDLAVKFLNAGDRAWVRGTPGRQANLGSSEPLDNLRDFNAGVLVTPLPGTLNRYATTDEAVVNPGEVGTFSMRLRAPIKPGVYQIHVRPVVDGATWLDDDGVFLQITVR